jgi:hypothetical protein
MCRSIKTLRPPFTDDVTRADMEAAALQYVRKVAGMRAPAKVNTEAFNAAVAEISDATQRLLDSLVVRPAPHTHVHADSGAA